MAIKYLNAQFMKWRDELKVLKQRVSHETEVSTQPGSYPAAFEIVRWGNIRQ